MSIKLNGSNSGSVELDVLADAGLNTAITFPATSGEVIVSNTSGVINVQGDEVATNITSGDSIGKVQFNDGDGYTFADIEVQADANAGSGDYPGRLVFSTTADGSASPTERMRITSDGDVNWTATGASIPTNNVSGTTVRGSDGGLSGSRGNGGKYFIFYHFSNSTEIGSIQNNSGTGISYNISSDYRLKENSIALSDGIKRVKLLKPLRFNFIANPEITVDGFFAHEVQDVVPEAISGQKDAVNEDGSIKPQGIDQSKLVPLLTAALQEAIQKIETQAGVITTLDARLTALEGGAS